MQINRHEVDRIIGLLKRKKGLIAIISLSVMISVTLVSYMLPRMYEAKTLVFIEKNVVNELVKGVAATPSMEDTVRVLNYSLNSRSLMLRTIGELDMNLKGKSDTQVEMLIADLTKHTEVKVKDKEGLFTINFRHSDPKFARDYVNTLVRSYIEQNATAKRDESLKASTFLNDQIATYKERLSKAEKAVAQFKSSKGGVAGIDESKVLQEVGTAQQKLYEIQLRRKIVEGQLQHSVKPGDHQLRLAALQRRLEELRIDYTDSYPEVRAVKAQIDSLRDEVKSALPRENASDESQSRLMLQAELQALKESEVTINQHIAQSQKLLGSIPASKAALEQLESEKNSQKSMYDTLFARHDQSEVGKEMQLQDKTTVFRIVDPAVTPMKPVSPNRKLIIPAGILAGLLLAVAVIIQMDRLSETVKSLQAAKGFGLPVLAVIPFVRSESEIAAARSADRRIYLISGACFSPVLVLLFLELMGVTMIDRWINSIHLPF